MPKSSNVTIYDVAEDAGVGIATVSRLLNTPERVSKKSREKILASIDKLGFVPKADARERARKGIGRIGVITPFFTIASFVQRLRGIANALVDTPYEFTIYPVDSLARLHGYYAMLSLPHRLDGLIVISLPIDESEKRRLKNSEIPTIFIESQVSGFSSIDLDDRHGGKLAAQHFIAKGHTLCGYVGETTVTLDYALISENPRLIGYQKHLLENNIPLPEKYIKLPSYPSKEHDTHIVELLDLDNPPTAIFCASDDLAMRVLKIARSKNIRIPEDLAVIGFDDIDIASYLDLTTISQSLDQTGVFAVELLLAQISDPTRPIQNIYLQLELIERGTT